MHRHARTSFVILLATFASATRAEIFCVETAAEFSDALTIAGINNEDDEIQLRKGTYPMADGVYFDYDPNASENFDLEISGGWYQHGTACGAQSDNPWETILDGEDTETVLRLASIHVQQSSVSVRLLTFISGFQSFNGETTTGGLEVLWWWLVDEGPTAGTISIERNVFLSNEGDIALWVNGGFPRVTNNLFLLNGNQSSDAAAAYLSTWNVFGSTFTNNTVIANGGEGLLIYGRGEVVNNSFWDNDGPDVEQLNSSADLFLYNNNYQSFDVANSAILEDNISVEPEYQHGLFNYTPVRGSPLVDAGREPQGALALWYLTDVDINDSPRLVGPHVDIGAFENEKILVDGFDPSGPF